MKLKYIIFPFIALLLLSNCRGKKKKYSKTDLVIKIEASEMYCGGAAPPPEIVKELATMKPFANRQVEVFLTPNVESKPIIYTTNNKGEITLPRNLADQIYINVYASVDTFKPSKESEKELYECYKGFVLGNLMQIKMSVPEDKVSTSTMIQCNPCLPPAP